MTIHGIEGLAAKLHQQWPEAIVQIDSAETPDGTSWIHAQIHDQAVEIEWRPALGFGVSVSSGKPASELFSGPDSIVLSADTVLETIKKRLVAPTAVSLQGNG